MLIETEFEPLHPDLEVFDFRNRWPEVQPHLEHPDVRKALFDGMSLFCKAERDRLLDEGYSPIQISNIQFDPSKGPWFYTPGKWWSQRARFFMELAMERGEFKCRCSNPDNLNPAERSEYNRYEAQFFPRRSSHNWYQCFQAVRWLAPWLQELGKHIFPQWRWKVLKGERYSLAVASDHADRLRLVFDILNFDVLSAIELLELAKDPESETEPQPEMGDLEAIIKEVQPSFEKKGTRLTEASRGSSDE